MSAFVGGSAVAIEASAADTGSGIASVRFEVKVQGSSTYATIATDTTAPYEATWDAAGAPSGTAELRLLITDAAGNQRASAVVPVTVDSTGPSVTLGDPGGVVSGAVALTATTGGGAARVVFSLSPAGAGSWTVFASDTTAPFGAALPTGDYADGVYDLRAIGYDVFGNPSAPATRSGVRFDNTVPRLLSATPEDGSVSTSANAIVLTASEPVTAVGALLDGVAAPAPVVSGSRLTFPTGALADGLHVLSGRFQDASGTTAPFRVAVTIESTPADDRAPVEKSASPDQTTLTTSAGALATVSVPPAAWPQRPSFEDFLVVRVDPSPALPSIGPSLAPASQLIEVTARWALANTVVTEFAAPIEITIPNSSGSPVVPALSGDGTSWRSLPLLAGATLPAGQADGFYRDGAGAHVLTRHLTYFALLRDLEPPTPPRHIAGVVADDGLTLRWIPGSDNSGQLGQVLLSVNGQSYQGFDVTQFETKLGAFAADDTREFTFVQLDAAGNRSRPSESLRAVPNVAGLGLEQAAAALAKRGFKVGTVRKVFAPRLAPGTVVAPIGVSLAVESTPIDLVVSRDGAPQTKLVFQAAAAKRVVLGKRITVLAARLKATRPAKVTAMLYSPRGIRLHTWQRFAKPGASIVELRFASRVRRAGSYRLAWVARSGKETVSTSVRVELIRPRQARTSPRPHELEVVLASMRPSKEVLQPALQRSLARIVAQARPEETFALAAAERRDVRVIVVDVDEYGISFLRDLRTVFPSMGLIAISSDPVTLARAAHAGASLALPRSIRREKLASTIVLVGRR